MVQGTLFHMRRECMCPWSTNFSLCFEISYQRGAEGICQSFWQGWFQSQGGVSPVTWVLTVLWFVLILFHAHFLGCLHNIKETIRRWKPQVNNQLLCISNSNKAIFAAELSFVGGRGYSEQSSRATLSFQIHPKWYLWNHAEPYPGLLHAKYVPSLWMFLWLLDGLF